VTGDTEIQSIVLENELDRPELPGEGRDISINRIIQEYRIARRESTPVH
jgi:hypothetical protein